MVLFGHVSDGVRDGRAVRAYDRVHLVLSNQLLVDADGRLGLGAIILDQKLNWAPEDPPFFVDVLLAEQVALAYVATLYGIPSRDRDRGAEPNRLLRHARRHCANDEHSKNDNEPVSSHC